MFLYYTFSSFYTIIWNARLLHNLLELHQYAKIITFTSKKNVESSPWFTSGQNILHLLISQVLLNKTFEHVILKNDGGEKKKHVSSFFLPLVRQFIKPAYSFMLRRISGRNGKIFNIMVPSMAKNMNILCSNLFKKHPNIIFLHFIFIK